MRLVLHCVDCAGCHGPKRARLPLRHFVMKNFENMLRPYAEKQMAERP